MGWESEIEGNNRQIFGRLQTADRRPVQGCAGISPSEHKIRGAGPADLTFDPTHGYLAPAGLRRCDGLCAG